MKSNSSSASNPHFDQEAFEQGLQEWVNQTPAGSNEDREEAARRILKCYNSKSPF